MQPPYLSVSLWDPTRGNANLLSSVRGYVSARSAKILGANTESVIIEAFPVAGLRPDEPTRVEIVQWDDAAEQIEITMPLGEYAEPMQNDDSNAWRPLLSDVAALILEINPALAAIGYDFSAASLPDTDFENFELAIIAGWINLERSSERQRSAFETLMERGIAARLGSGAWWSRWPPLSLTAEAPELSKWETSATVYEALTGEAAPDEPDYREPEPIVDRPQLWYWRPDAQLEDFTRFFGDTIAPIGLEPWIRFDDYPAGWLTGCAEVESDEFLTPTLLQQYRDTLEALLPRWAGIISVSVDWPLGVVGPEGGESIGPRVSDLWVDKTWAAPILADLERLFQGAHRKEIAGGVFWITSSSLVPDSAIDPFWTTEEAGSRELEIAATLGRAVRQSIVRMYGPQPGLTEASIRE